MNTPAENIRAEIAREGAISFARFMELALYCPLCGYYEKKKDTPGQRGDFYTSVSVGPLFGQLLAFQFAEWTGNCEVWSAERGTLRLIEAGAHDGRLAADILEWFSRKQPQLFERVEYCIVEPSETRREWQQRTLSGFVSQVQWFDKFPISHRPLRSPSFTIVFANELLDAFPVHRLGWDAQAKQWFEWGVTTKDGQFVWTRLAESPASRKWGIEVNDAQLRDILPHDFTTEVCPTAVRWWFEAATSLGQGKLLTFDYGLKAEEFFLPQRAGGTLRAYRQHHIADNPLANPGEQDLTAHVNFTALQRTGERAGLKTESLVSQSQFLTRIAEKVWSNGRGFGEWTTHHSRQLQTLTHPNHLGRAFHVLLQSHSGRASSPDHE